MTEAMTTPSGTEERPRCRVGSQTDHRCWRNATEYVDLTWPEPDVCAEHYRAIELRSKVDELHYALDKMGRWIAEWDDPTEDEDRLKSLAFRMREEALEELWRATVRAKAADLIAIQRPDSKPLSFEQAQRHEELRLRTDALIDARVILEDLRLVPEQAFGSGSRWRLAAALKAAATEASAEHARCWRESGLG
jgi:hypothetical protein